MPENYRAPGSSASCLFAMLACLCAGVLGGPMTPETNFTISSDSTVEGIKEFWTIHPPNFMSKPKAGVFLTKNGAYQSSLLTYLKVIDLVNQFQAAYSITFGEMKPKTAVERQDETYSKHADAVALIFSHSPLPATPQKETPDDLPIDGGVFYVIRGDRGTYITFRRYNALSALSQRYTDLLYEQTQQYNPAKKAHTCEIKDTSFDTLFLKVIGNSTNGELQVVYKTNNDRSDVPYNPCFTLSHYERYLGHHYFYPALAARTPDERNSEILLTNARFDADRVALDFGFEGEYDQQLFDKLNDRVKSLDKVKNMPAKKLGGLLKLQNMLSLKAGQLKNYVIDFQKGIQIMQEHFLTGISQSKTRKMSDVGALVEITNKLANLDIRQNKVYTKFALLHKKLGKEKKLDRIDAELQSLDAVIQDSIRKIENKGLGEIVARSQELADIFKEIVANEHGLDNLRSLRNLGITYQPQSSFTTVVLCLGGLVVLFFLARTFVMIRRSRRTHFL